MELMENICELLLRGS
jgi:hypothetical protein